MSFIEFIGFIITFAAFIFLVIKRYAEMRQRSLNPEEYDRKEKEQEENLRRFMRDRGMDFGEQPHRSAKPKPKKQAKPPLQPMQHEVQMKLREAQRQQILQASKNVSVQPDYYGRETASAKKQSMAFESGQSLQPGLNQAESYEVIRDDRSVRGNLLVKNLKSPRDMLVIKEIFDKPLSMRD